jgi:DNA repair exonuclease SbcCD ATPase subunit
MNEITKQYGGYEVKIIYVAKNNLKFRVVTGNDTVKMTGGFNTIICEIALRLALSETNKYVKCNIFYLDESFDSHDDYNVKSIQLLLKILKEYFDCTFLITHDKDFIQSDCFTKKLHIKKIDDDSKIIVLN